MEEIIVQKPDKQELEKMGVFTWPIWEKEASEFPWTYDSKEECYIISGKVTVTPDDSRQPVTVQTGDFVVFPAGMSCTWEIHENIKKHYNFS